ncbi:hypothetical protein [Raoultella ornithinolytica]|uniref:hypothetical protein n=1 Tax=Raoultella ornithinolytica TaxID=54291 RepID=UPI0010F03DEF|nr:Uncharacterised protein [Raoultella ornithinolytica]
MTTDITEMALLVSKAKASVFTLEYISQFEPADIDSDDVDLRFEVDGRDTGTNVSIVDECGQAARVIGALLEALEKAQAKNALVAGGIDASTKLHERIAELDAELEREREKSRRVMSRIAELESRTVTVKLPPAIAVEDWMVDIDVYEADLVRALLKAAGIKWEAE